MTKTSFNRPSSTKRRHSNHISARLGLESLETRVCLTTSVGWDGPGLGSAELTYHIGDAPSYLNQSEVEAAIETALEAWSDVVDVEFTPTDQPGLLDSIDFEFANIDGQGGTLAYAYFPDDINPHRIAGDVRFDTSDRWEIGNAQRNRAFDLIEVAVHEIGHSLGLTHIDHHHAVLAPSVSANSAFTGLHAEDIEAALAIYAPAVKTPVVTPPVTNVLTIDTTPANTPATPSLNPPTESTPGGDQESPTVNDTPSSETPTDNGRNTSPFDSPFGNRWLGRRLNRFFRFLRWRFHQPANEVAQSNPAEVPSHVHDHDHNHDAPTQINVRFRFRFR